MIDNSAFHVFYLHSNITLSVVIKYIETYEVDIKKSIFIINRKLYHPYLDDKNTIDISSFTITYKMKYFIKNFRVKTHIRKILTQKIKEKYYLYIPQFRIDFFNIFANKHLCLGIHIIEEGLLAYRSKEKLTTRELKSFGSIKWYFKMFILSMGTETPKPFIIKNHPLLKSFIGISKYSFENFENRITLSNPFLLTKKIPNQIVYVFSNLYFEKMSREEKYIYVEKIFQILVYLNDKYKREILIKFHPSIFKVKNLKEVILTKIQKGKLANQVTELQNHYSLEHLAANSNSIFIGTHSSVLIYASLNNCQVISDYNIFYNNDDFWNQFSKEIIRNIKFINEVDLN